MERLQTHLDEAMNLLGDGHFATQAFARMLLAQAAAHGPRTEALEAEAERCQKYLDRCAAAMARAE